MVDKRIDTLNGMKQALSVMGSEFILIPPSLRWAHSPQPPTANVILGQSGTGKTTLHNAMMQAKDWRIFHLKSNFKDDKIMSFPFVSVGNHISPPNYVTQQEEFEQYFNLEGFDSSKAKDLIDEAIKYLNELNLFADGDINSDAIQMTPEQSRVLLLFWLDVLAWSCNYKPYERYIGIEFFTHIANAKGGRVSDWNPQNKVHITFILDEIIGELQRNGKLGAGVAATSVFLNYVINWVQANAGNNVSFIVFMLPSEYQDAKNFVFDRGVDKAVVSTRLSDFIFKSNTLGYNVSTIEWDNLEVLQLLRLVFSNHIQFKDNYNDAFNFCATTIKSLRKLWGKRTSPEHHLGYPMFRYIMARLSNADKQINPYTLRVFLTQAIDLTIARGNPDRKTLLDPEVFNDAFAYAGVISIDNAKYVERLPFKMAVEKLRSMGKESQSAEGEGKLDVLELQALGLSGLIDTLDRGTHKEFRLRPVYAHSLGLESPQWYIERIEREFSY